MLIALVPLGGDFEQEHDALVRPAELNEARLADVVAQPARFFHVFVAGITGVLQALDQVVEFVALQHFLVHGEELRARLLRQLDEVLPAFGIVPRVPHHAVNIFGDVALEAAQAVSQNEGVHVVFQAG